MFCWSIYFDNLDTKRKWNNLGPEKKNLGHIYHWIASSFKNVIWYFLIEKLANNQSAKMNVFQVFLPKTATIINTEIIIWSWENQPLLQPTISTQLRLKPKAKWRPAALKSSRTATRALIP